MMKKASTALAALLLLPALAACGSDDEGSTPATSSEIAAEEEFNQADVDFATDMIQHHAQALAMVDMTVGRDLSPEFATLTEQIQLAQGPEIEQMVDWLTTWEQPVPETVRDHANAHGDDHGSSDGAGAPDGTDGMDDMPGMMSDEDLDELMGVEGDRFETMWLTLMIEHHEGAIEMAGVEVEDGEFPEAIALAESIIAGQTAEIEQMKSMLDS